MKLNPIGALLELSRRASGASPDERASIRDAFDTTLQRMNAGYVGNPNGTWVGQAPTNYGINERSFLAVSTMFACVRNIAEDCGKLPLKFYDHKLVKGREVKERIHDKLTHILACAPNDRITAFDFWSTMFQWVAGWGICYAQMEYNAAGELVALWPIHPNRVLVKSNNGVMRFDVYNNDGSITKIKDSDMFRVFWLSPDGYTGYSPIKVFQNTLEFASAQERYAQHFMRNMGRPAGVLTTDQTLKPQARNNLKQSWQEQYSGPLNAGKTPVLESGVTYQTISAPMRDAEFVAQWKFSKERIAEAYRMPLRKLQDAGRAAGWSTLDAEESDYVNSCLLPFLVRFEQRIRLQLLPLFRYPETVQVKFSTHELLRGDMASRTTYLNALQVNGSITPNERREWEDMNPIDDPAMDLTYVNGATIPLNMAGKIAQANADATNESNSEPTPSKPTKQTDEDIEEDNDED